MNTDILGASASHLCIFTDLHQTEDLVYILSRLDLDEQLYGMDQVVVARISDDRLPSFTPLRDITNILAEHH